MANITQLESLTNLGCNSLWTQFGRMSKIYKGVHKSNSNRLWECLKGVAKKLYRKLKRNNRIGKR